MEKIESAYRMDETTLVSELIKEAMLSKTQLFSIEERAKELVKKVRESRLQKRGIDAFLQTYDLSSTEGIVLMCLAEALLRIPDKATIDSLIKDKISKQNWQEHLGKSSSWFVNASTWGLMLTGKILQEEPGEKTYLNSLKKLIQCSGEPIIRVSILQAMKILGKQFVMGETIEEALSRAIPQERKGYRYTYDMLGEAAKTSVDAEKYYESYKEAILEVGQAGRGLGPILAPGISVKLSALHPRFEWNNRERVLRELLPKLKALVLLAKNEDIGLTIDAEEADRLQLSLLLIEAIIKDPDLGQWEGFGFAVQAYQKRAIFVVDWVIDLVKTVKRRITIRLVKGAYWDSEIKWTQERGLKDYPVFTRKASTDLSYLVCARKLLNATDFIFPQFATHNAHTVSYILELAHKEQAFEFQCLHGMGNTLYDNIVGDNNLNRVCRVYAPVGGYENLLAYLVRRLLENGANSSFVNRILDENVEIDTLVADPVLAILSLSEKRHAKIPLPINLYQPERPNSKGLDISDPVETAALIPKIESFITNMDFEKKPEQLNYNSIAFLNKEERSLEKRIEFLKNMANLLEEHKPELLSLLIREGGKCLPDAFSEVREAIDYCWYYAARLKEDFQVRILPGPTGEHNQLSLHGRGMLVCISPWNFPLAIFLGQIVGALAAGNSVVAKPASQTPRIATKAIELLYLAGFSREEVQLVIGEGKILGSRLIEDPHIAGVLFTGSTDTARGINQKLAARLGPIVPFIAETGGQNVMIVDSSALAEQVISDVVTSAFNSAGQRCSALRVLFIQEEVACRSIEMLKGAMQELKMGDPLDLATDIGPVIDKKSCEALLMHVEAMKQKGKLIFECALPPNLPTLPRGVFFAPRVYEIENIGVLTEEVFGPILHIIRYKAENLDKVIESINNTGFGLTLGIHSRIDETVNYIQSKTRVGNTYVNRNMIGAVVGVQPFGGEGLSGTGPKAGGPHMLPRLAIERTLSINTTAAGGNATLMSMGG